jgi:hypothetical protein
MEPQKTTEKLQLQHSGATNMNLPLIAPNNYAADKLDRWIDSLYVDHVAD